MAYTLLAHTFVANRPQGGHASVFFETQCSRRCFQPSSRVLLANRPQEGHDSSCPPQEGHDRAHGHEEVRFRVSWRRSGVGSCFLGTKRCGCVFLGDERLRFRVAFSPGEGHASSCPPQEGHDSSIFKTLTYTRRYFKPQSRVLLANPPQEGHDSSCPPKYGQDHKEVRFCFMYGPGGVVSCFVGTRRCDFVCLMGEELRVCKP